MSNINLSQNPYMTHLKKEMKLANLSFDSVRLEQLLEKAFAIFDEAGHSGASSNFGIQMTVYALNVVNTHIKKGGYVIGEQYSNLPDWVRAFNLESDDRISVTKLANMEDGPDKWILTDVKRTLELFHNLILTDVEFKQLIDYFEAGAGFKLLSPATGIASEWVKHNESEGIRPYYQNNRVSSVFGLDKKEGSEDFKSGYCLDSVVFSDNAGLSWFTCGLSRKVFDFPYTDKTLYVTVKRLPEDISDEEEQRIRGSLEWVELHPVVEPKVKDRIRHANDGYFTITDIVTEDDVIRYTVANSNGNPRTITSEDLKEENTIAYEYSLGSAKEDRRVAELKYLTWSRILTDEEADAYYAEVDRKAEEAAAERKRLYDLKIQETADKEGISFDEAKERIEEEARKTYNNTIGRIGDSMGIQVDLDDGKDAELVPADTAPTTEVTPPTTEN